MILVFDKMWYVVSSTSKSLAYLTHYEENSAFEKRKDTGIKWASGYRKDQVEPKTFDNTPTTCFKIVDSVSRWSTSNKLIRVEDPRGFVCEISTGNLVNLLKTTVVDNSVIKHSCVWGRDGGVNVLLPVNSEPYLEALKNVKEVAKPPVKFSEVNVGDTVEFKAQYREGKYVYLGRGTRTFKVVSREYDYEYYASRFNRKYNLRVQPDITESKPVYIFAAKTRQGTMFDFFKSAPKIKSVTSEKSQEVDDLRKDMIEDSNVRWYDGIEALANIDRWEKLERVSITSVKWK